MADLSDIQAAQTVKIAGSNTSGAEDNYVNADSNGNLQVIDASDGSVTPGTVASKSSLIGGQYNTALPTLTNGQQAAIQVDSSGRLLVSSAPLPTTSSKFSFGDIATSSTTQVAVQRTAYTEQTSNSTMSIASSNANDTSVGTGARSVTITYLDSTGAGPFTTTITLNGTSFVNAGVSNMCFIERIVVATVGSARSNIGTLTLKASTGGGGATVGTINATDNQTLWAHHYVPSGKTSYISGFSINSSSTTTGAGGLFVLKASTPTVSNTPELLISDFHRLYGQQSSTNTRTYLSPIQVIGPARIRVYVTPETSTSITYRASFDYIDN